VSGVRLSDRQRRTTAREIGSSGAPLSHVHRPGGGDSADPTTSVARESAHDLPVRACAGVVAKIDQHSDRLLLVRAACVAENDLALGSMRLGTVSRLS